MQLDFHYYATYCAALLAGYTHGEALAIGYSSQFTDECTVTLLKKIKGPKAAATTQLQSELIDMRTDFLGLQEITRIWASFHFLPYDLYADVPKGNKSYKRKYRLLCDVNGELVADTVNLAKGRGPQAAGLAMHVLADTWAHRYFAGTPALVLNNTNYHFFELLQEGEQVTERRISFNHNPLSPDDPEKGAYTNTLYQSGEHSVMNLGHGRAGHLPDYSYIRYKYLPAWADYREIVKDNPSEYYHAFCQMIYAMKYLRGSVHAFETNQYDMDAAAPWETRIRRILGKRQTDASSDWKAFGEELSGEEIEPFDIEKYQQEYMDAAKEKKDKTFLGKFILAALAQKSMVTNKIYRSGSLLAGVSVDFDLKGFQGIRDYMHLVIDAERRSRND